MLQTMLNKTFNSLCSILYNIPGHSSNHIRGLRELSPEIFSHFIRDSLNLKYINP